MPVEVVSPCPCQGMTAETVRDSATVKPDQESKISVAVKYWIAVFVLIMTGSLAISWVEDHINKVHGRHDPRLRAVEAASVRDDGFHFMSCLPTVADRGKMPLLRFTTAIGHDMRKPVCRIYYQSQCVLTL